MAIAPGLISRPKLLLLDEPSLGLAPIIMQQVYRVIADIRRQGTTVLLVEQNAYRALSVADRGYVLETAGWLRRASLRHCGTTRMSGPPILAADGLTKANATRRSTREARTSCPAASDDGATH